MAIFHLHNDTISRGKGQSVVAAAAYRARERLLDETTGQTKDYTKKTEQPVLFSGIYMPKNAPQWTREQLWNAAERAEDEHNRKSWRVAITAQDMDMALMDELTPEQNRRLLQDYIREQFTRYGYAVDANIHGPHKDGDQRNIHAHLLITMRTLDAKGFSPVKRQMDRKEFSQWVDHWREAWAKTAARHLERAGHHQAAERTAYGHLTLEQQRKIALEKGDHEHAADLVREASQHAGPKATQMERDGKASERGNENRATATRNRAHRERLGELHRELSQVNSEIAITPEPTPQPKPAPAPDLPAAWWQAASKRAEQARTAATEPAPRPEPTPEPAAPAPTPAPAPAPSPTAAWLDAANKRADLHTPAPRFYASPRAERRDRWEDAAAKRLQRLRNWQALEREQQQRRFTEAAKLERGDAVKAFNTQQRHDLTHLLYKEQAEALAAELQRQQEKLERWDKPTQRREPRPRTHPPRGFKAWLSGLFRAKAATPGPGLASARPLADAEPQKAPEESLRERLEEQEEEKQEENRQQKGHARPPEPHHERAEKSRAELRTEQLRQHRGQRRTPPRR